MKSHRFRLSFVFVTLLCLCLLQTGCAMCCGTYDEAYAGHGGRWQRSDLFHGRVGSPFSDPNAHYGDEYYTDGQMVERIDETELETIE